MTRLGLTVAGPLVLPRRGTWTLGPAIWVEIPGDADDSRGDETCHAEAPAMFDVVKTGDGYLCDHCGRVMGEKYGCLFTVRGEPFMVLCPACAATALNNASKALAAPKSPPPPLRIVGLDA